MIRKIWMTIAIIVIAVSLFDLFFVGGNIAWTIFVITVWTFIFGLELKRK